MTLLTAMIRWWINYLIIYNKGLFICFNDTITLKGIRKWINFLIKVKAWCHLYRLFSNNSDPYDTRFIDFIWLFFASILPLQYGYIFEFWYLLHRRKGFEFSRLKCYLLFLDVLSIREKICQRLCHEKLQHFSNICFPQAKCLIAKSGKSESCWMYS